jgi:4-hydroxybenzoate polyprenyltransferase
MNATLRAWIDLLRLQFFFAWPLLFCSGYLLATATYGPTSYSGLALAALIGFFGFEAGLVLNDYIDREYDSKDVETGRLTRYWRFYGTRPIPGGLITPRIAAGLIIGLITLTAGLILLLPYPHSIIVLLIMCLCYALEIFYQEEKRQQAYPFAQVIGRIDFALFPVAGYLCAGLPDKNALLYFAFFYPFALAHLGVNDIIDTENDQARGMKTIPILYSPEKTAWWIAGFTAVHIATAFLFMGALGWCARAGILAGLGLLLYANIVILEHRADGTVLPDAALRVLPCFHGAMVLYSGGIVLGAIIGLVA